VSPPRCLGERAAAEIVHRTLAPEVPVVQQEHSHPAGALEAATVVRLSHILRRQVRSDRNPAGEIGGVYVDMEIPAGTSPNDLTGRGVAVLMYVDEGDIGLRARHWLAFGGDGALDVVAAPLDPVRADLRRVNHLAWVLSRAGAGGRARGLLLDCAELDEDDFRTYLGCARDLLGKLSIEPMSVADFGRERVACLHGAGGLDGWGGLS
jgi:hypothetical protein